MDVKMDDFVIQAGEKGYGVDVEISETQEALTEKHVKPIVDDLFDLTVRARKVVDVKYSNKKKENSKTVNRNAGEVELEYYPTGYCREIRDEVFDALKESEMLKNLVKNGLLFKQVYVALNNKYTHNAIQLGSLFIDVANDSVGVGHPVVFTDIKNVDYRNLDEYDAYYKLAESYLNLKLYPNIYLKEIAEVFPMIALDSCGFCHFFHHQEITLYKDISLNFQLAKNFQENNSFKHRVLPNEYAKLFGVLEKDAKDGQFGTPKELLEKYFEAAGKPYAAFFAESLENEMRRLIDDLRMRLHFLQFTSFPPKHKVIEMQILGILPPPKLKV